MNEDSSIEFIYFDFCTYNLYHQSISHFTLHVAHSDYKALRLTASLQNNYNQNLKDFNFFLKRPFSCLSSCLRILSTKIAFEFYSTSTLLFVSLFINNNTSNTLASYRHTYLPISYCCILCPRANHRIQRIGLALLSLRLKHHQSIESSR